MSSARRTTSPACSRSRTTRESIVGFIASARASSESRIGPERTTVASTLAAEGVRAAAERVRSMRRKRWVTAIRSRTATSSSASAAAPLGGASPRGSLRLTRAPPSHCLSDSNYLTGSAGAALRGQRHLSGYLAQGLGRGEAVITSPSLPRFASEAGEIVKSVDVGRITLAGNFDYEIWAISYQSPRSLVAGER